MTPRTADEIKALLNYAPIDPRALRDLAEMLFQATPDVVDRYEKVTDHDHSAAFNRAIEKNPLGEITCVPGKMYTLGNSIVELNNGAFLDGRGARTRTEGSGNNPAFHITGNSIGMLYPQIRRLYAQAYNSGTTEVGQSRGGVAHTQYRPGSSFCKISAPGVTIEYVRCQNYDVPYLFDDDVFSILFRGGQNRACNYGVDWPQSFRNSGERIEFVGHGLNNCNIAIRINHTPDTDGDGIGNNGSTVGGSFFFRGCPIDYNILAHVGDILMGDDNHFDCTVDFLQCHIETSPQASGGSSHPLPRIRNSGMMSMAGCMLYENGGVGQHPHIFELGSFYGQMSVERNRIAVKGQPILLNLRNSNPGRIHYHGNYDAYGGNVNWTSEIVEHSAEGRVAPRLAANIAAPTLVPGYEVWRTNNTQPTVVHSFLGGYPGQRLIVLVTDVNSTFDPVNGNIRGLGGQNWTANRGDHLSGVFDGTHWRCAKLESGDAAA